jgi:hypothetical protein
MMHDKQCGFVAQMTDDASDYRRVWRQNWLCSLLSLADIDLQRERWLNKEITNPQWSYVEFMCFYFGDCNLRDYGRYLEANFVSQAEFDSVKDFHEALRSYEEPTHVYDHEAILNDPKWQEITAKGRDSLQRLRGLITDPAEQEIFSSKPYARPLSAGDFSWPLRPS